MLYSVVGGVIGEIGTDFGQTAGRSRSTTVASRLDGIQQCAGLGVQYIKIAMASATCVRAVVSQR